MKRIVFAAVLIALLAAGKSFAAERYLPAYETALSKLGARLLVNPQPQKLSWKRSPMGTFMETETSFYAGVSADGIVQAMPFQKDISRLADVRSSISMNTARYAGRHYKGLDVSMKITAPFYPRDVKLCTAPYFYFDITVENKSASAKSGKVFIGEMFLRGEKTATAEAGGLQGILATGGFGETKRDDLDMIAHPEKYKKIKGEMGLFGETPSSGGTWMAEKFLSTISSDFAEKPPMRSAGYIAPFSLAPGEKVTLRFIYAVYVKDDILFRKDGVNFKFKYTELFKDINAVVDYAHTSRDAVLKKSALFESLIEDMSLPDSYKDFLSYAFQSWMINIWWGAAPGVPDWFSEMEGDCIIHSTVDVSYNTVLIYYELWPELMRMQLDEWPMFRVDRVIMHDMGRMQQLTGTEYSMPVEENANYILMLHHYLSVTGDEAFVKEKMPVVRELVEYILDTDENKDGFPEKGNYNTYERHLPNPLGAEDVVYVAVKAYASMRAAEELALKAGDKDLAARAKDFEKKFETNFDKRAWSGDHYLICLQKTIKPGAINRKWTLPRSAFPTGDNVYIDDIAMLPGTMNNRDEVPLKYFDGYTILTSNGLFYLLRGNMGYGLDEKRIADDLLIATIKTWRDDGCPHTSNPDDKGMWLSANIWRDMTAAYLGYDWSRNFNAYWKATLEPKVRDEGVFADSHWYDIDPQKGWDLRYYPRGATAFGVPTALAGMRFDYAARTLSFKPAAGNLRIPLFAFADWDKGVMPWLTVKEKDGKKTFDISNKEMITGWKVEFRED